VHQDAFSSTETFLQLAIETLTDLGNHVIADPRLGAVDWYSDIPRLLYEAGYINVEKRENWIHMIGFRNVLVHDYLDVHRRLVSLPVSFDAGERETLAVAKSRGYAILTNENQIKNWCKREQIEYWDLPGLLRALWRMNVVSRDLVRSLLDQIEAKDRIVFRVKEAILQE
jgi:predicted nucleic acid-binding protein